ncbi:MAG: hypothetical protein F4Z01_00015 [Gammaproteobacteria bacterium]|nr:hypothetical protein [Gammaproteobacteria bacterium]MYF38031.1 hypothetical protein [Gammaproteobacteria bacterium]
MRSKWFFNVLIFLTTSTLVATTSNADDETASPNLADKVAHVTTENFKTEVLEANVPVLVDFTATWCAPCKELDPIIESLMPEMSGRAKVFKLDIDESQEIFTQYGLTGVPTVLFFNNGEVEDRIVSPQSREVYVKYLEGMIDGSSALEVKVALLDEDAFRRDFILRQRPTVLESILEHRPTLLTERFENGQSPLSLILNHPASSRDRRLDIVLSLEEKAEPISSESSTVNPSDLVGLGRCDEFKMLLEKDPEAVNRPDPDGNTPLLTALLQATRLKKDSCLRAVLDAGADPRVKEESNFTLGHAAVLSFDTEIQTELLAKGLNPLRTDQDGRNSLHWAAFYGYPDTVKVLLDYGVDPTIQALNGETAADIVRDARDQWVVMLDDSNTSAEAVKSVVELKDEILALLEPSETETD